jgi:hypothetical protein
MAISLIPFFGHASTGKGYGRELSSKCLLQTYVRHALLAASVFSHLDEIIRPDPERVTVEFLVATAALDKAKSVVIWASKDAMRLALPGEAQGESCTGRPPHERQFQQFTAGVASSGSARSVSPHADSQTRKSRQCAGRRRKLRCGNGPATIRRSSAIDPSADNSPAP